LVTSIEAGKPLVSGGGGGTSKVDAASTENVQLELCLSENNINIINKPIIRSADADKLQSTYINGQQGQHQQQTEKDNLYLFSTILEFSKKIQKVKEISRKF